MVPLHVSGAHEMGKALVLLLMFFFSLFHGNTQAQETVKEATAPLRILLEQPPSTLNPRGTIDATGQRINALLFRGLTRIDFNLQPQADLAERWEVEDHGRVWKFFLKPGLLDHDHQPIDVPRMVACLENYRSGTPISPLRSAFPAWKSTEALSNSVIFKLKNPDPYFPRNLSLLRYFRNANDPTPCTEPRDGRKIIGSGFYQAPIWDLAPEERFLIVPTSLAQDRKPIEFQFVQDDNTKSLKLLRGEVDVIQNALSLSKTRWLQKNYASRLTVLERQGVAVSYLAFNFRDPILARHEVRQAIAEAIDRETIVKNKFMGFAELAGSLLSPLLPESAQFPLSYNPQHAQELLENAGFSADKSGVRIRLHYKSTPAREGIETALLFQNMLRKIGIELTIDVVEPAVFFASVRKGYFQLYSSRWLGVADGSILFNTLHTGQLQNRIAYSNPEMDRLLDEAIAEPLFEKRLPVLKKVQLKMAEELPYFPLWYWNSAALVRKEFSGIQASELSLSGALEPLTHLR